MNMHTTQRALPSDLTLRSEQVMDDLLTPDALRFIHTLHQKFNDRRRALLKARKKRQQSFDDGSRPAFPQDSNYIHTSRWKIAPVKPEINARVLEFVGPADVPLNYLNGIQADVFVADLEDATVPRWKNIIRTHQSLLDGISGRNNLSAFPILGLKPRSLARTDDNVLINNEPISASLFDFGLFFFHNAPRLMDKGLSPYLLLSKVESNCEARWWNQVFMFSQYHMGIPQGTVKSVVVVDNVLAGFQLNEIIYELRDHTAGLTFEPLNYLQSIVEKFSRTIKLPTLSHITMEHTGLNAVRRLIIDTCYLRGARNIGLPVHPEDFEAVNGDILAGYNGMRLSNPAHADQIIQSISERDDEILRMEEYQVHGEDLLQFPLSRVEAEDFRAYIRYALIYLTAMEDGKAWIEIDGKQIDKAFAGLIVTQLWQWLHNTEILDNGKAVTRELYQDIMTAELEKIRKQYGSPIDESLSSAVRQLDNLVVDKQFRGIQ